MDRINTNVESLSYAIHNVINELLIGVVTQAWLQLLIMSGVVITPH